MLSEVVRKHLLSIKHYFLNDDDIEIAVHAGWKARDKEIDDLKSENAKLREALEFYAKGSEGDDLEPKPEKAHLYEKDYPVDHAYWRQRSMSDYWSGRRAREALNDLRKGGE